MLNFLFWRLNKKFWNECTTFRRNSWCNRLSYQRPNWQCCHIWRIIANLATFDTNLLQKFPFGFLVFLATFLATFESLAKKLVLNQFKSYFGSISLCFDVDIFGFWKSFDVDILGFQKSFDVGLLEFSEIWLLFAQTFWQHWR